MKDAPFLNHVKYNHDIFIKRRDSRCFSRHTVVRTTWLLPPYELAG